jgi:hypothetical protein
MTNSPTAAAYSAAYETGALESPTEYHSIDRSLTVDLTDPRLARVTRLRLLTDRDCPFWDLSYCHGQLKDGTEVRVQLPQSQWSKRKPLKVAIVDMAREAGVYAKGLGLLDAISTLR